MTKKIVIRVEDPIVKGLLVNVCKSPMLMNMEQASDEVQYLMEMEGDFVAAKDLADHVKLTIPKDWYENCLKRAIYAGDYFNASATLSVLNRQLEQSEVVELIEKIVLTGDMQALYDIEEHSNETFSLAIWQNILLIRTVRLMWEKRYHKKSPLSSLFNFSKDYKNTLDHFDINILGEYTFFLGKKTFKCYDQYTLSQFVHCLNNLDGDAFVKRLAREIKNNSALS